MSTKNGTDPILSRREFLGAMTTVGASALLGSQPPLVRAAEQAPLSIGYLPITDASPLLIAHANGYFQEEGLQVEPPKRVRSWSTLAESFMTGKFDVTHMLLPMPVWLRFKNKAPVKVLAWNHTNGSAITVRADSGIHDFSDLGGKQIAVPYWYSMHNIILQMGLRQAGLQPVIQSQAKKLERHQTNLFILSPPEMPAGLAGRKIDGYIVAEPFNALAEVKLKAKIMRFTGDIWQNHPCCVVVMNELVTKERPVFTQKVINAIVRAQIWLNDHPDKAAAILGKEGGNYLPVSARTLERVFLKYDQSTYGTTPPRAIRHPDWPIGRIGFQPYPFPSASRFIIQEMKNAIMEGDQQFLGALSVEAMARDLVEASFVRKAINAMGGPGRFREIDLNSPWERQEVISI